MVPHALAGTLPVRRQYRLPVDLVVAQKAVRRERLAPASARHRDTRRRLGRQPLHQYLRPLVQPLVTQRHPRKLPRHPAIRRHSVTQITRVDAFLLEFTITSRKSLRVNDYFGRLKGGSELCITKWFQDGCAARVPVRDSCRSRVRRALAPLPLGRLWMARSRVRKTRFPALAPMDVRPIQFAIATRAIEEVFQARIVIAGGPDEALLHHPRVSN